jgi:methylmalonyl-CoA/ethylmalonyl-CoA epimerase
MNFKPHHAAFTVNNLEESVTWYKEKLGFTVTHEYKKHGGGRAIVERGSVRIEFFNFGEATKPLPDYRKELMKDLHTVGIKHLCIEVEDLDAIVKDLAQKGVPTREIDTAGFGGRYTFFKDCNGILVELYQKP